MKVCSDLLRHMDEGFLDPGYLRCRPGKKTSISRKLTTHSLERMNGKKISRTKHVSPHNKNILVEGRMMKADGALLVLIKVPI